MAIPTEIIEKILELSCGCGTIHRDYSGRFMYGKTCTGYSGNYRQAEMVEMYIDACKDLGVERSVGSLKFDNMGKGIIMY